MFSHRQGLIDCLAQALGDRWAIAAALGVLGDLACVQDDDITATARYSDSLELFRNLGDKIGTASRLHNQAYLGLHQNNTAQAEALLVESLTLSHEFMNTGQIAYDLAGVGGVPTARGQPDRATQLLVRRTLG